MTNRYDNRKRLTVSCSMCQGSGFRFDERCRNCRGKGTTALANPFYVPPGEVPTWFQLGGGEGWLRELDRIGRIAGLSPSAAVRRRFEAVARRLQPWRLLSSAHCNAAAAQAILNRLMACRHSPERRLAGELRAPWTAAELGDLLVAARNRQVLWQLGRHKPRDKGDRFDIGRIPDDRLDALIQRHGNLALVEKLRQERNRRSASAAA